MGPTPAEPTPAGPTPEEEQAIKTAKILNDLNSNFGMAAPGAGNFAMIPTLSGVMENLMGLQDAFAQSGVVVPPPAQNKFAMNLPTGSRILDQPEREVSEGEEEEEEEETEEELLEKAFRKDCQNIKEYMEWIRQALKAERGSRAAKIRKALRKSLPPMRQKYHDRQEARELCKQARELIQEVEQTFADNIGIDTDDSDYDSEDSFFLASSDDEDLYF